MDDDYESLPDSSPVFAHMIAGACAGILEHTCMYPVDCIKTRLQALRSSGTPGQYSGIIDGLTQVIRTEGFTGCIRGIGVVVAGSGPAHAAYYATYEASKRHLVNQEDSYIKHTAGVGLAGVSATFVHDLIMTPTDAVKQRLQMFSSPYSGCSQCMRSVFLSEGGGAFFRAFTTQLVMNIPQQSVHFMVYELSQRHLNPEHEYRPSGHLCSGALAGAVSAAVATPLDVCKTFINTQSIQISTNPEGPVTTTATGLVSAAKSVYRFGGWSGFFRGLNARVIIQMPGTAISWSVYELFKYLLGHHRPREDLPPAKSLSPGPVADSIEVQHDAVVLHSPIPTPRQPL